MRAKAKHHADEFILSWFVALLIGTSIGITPHANAQARDDTAVRPLPRNLEIELALSAMPPHLRADATVYTLQPNQGFVVTKEGTNGFHALVSRLDPSAFRGAWPFVYRDDILLPIAFDAAGAKEHMRVYLDLARYHANGMEPSELKRLILERYASGYYGPPERSGVAYMMAPVVRAYRNAEQTDEVSTVNVPHYMFYAPGLTNTDVGGSRDHVFVFGSGPHAYMMHLSSETEREHINKECAPLIEGLCSFRAEFCVSGM